MNKERIFKQIIVALQRDLLVLQTAVKIAHDSATHSENVAENKYDTLGIEAAYLAHGQAKRAEEIAISLQAYENIPPSSLTDHQQVAISSFVHLQDQNAVSRWLWIGVEAGGLNFHYNDLACSIVTPSSPLGAKLIGQERGDIVELRIADNALEYELIELY